MNFELTPEQTQVRDVARDFAEAELHDKIAPYDERHEFPHAIVAKLGPLGFLGVLVPEEYGGAGLDYVSYALIVEELNRGDASVGITMWAELLEAERDGTRPAALAAVVQPGTAAAGQRRGARRVGADRARLGL